MAIHSKYSRKRNPYAHSEVLKVHRRVFERGSKWPWVIAVSVFVMAVTLGSFSLSLLLSVDTIMKSADSAVDSAGSFLLAAKNGDKELLEKSALEVSDAAHEIKAELQTGIWEFSSRLPLIGSDVQSVRTLADVIIDFSDSALVPMSKSGNILSLQSLAEDESINFAALPAVLVAVDEAMPALNRSALTLESLPPANIPQFRRVLDNVSDKIVTVNDFLRRIRPVFPYMPEIMGADGGTKNYLILAENTSEIHASGGFVGALGVLSIHDGKMEMGDFQNLTEVLSRDEAPAGATSEEISVFGPRCDVNHGDHNVIPDFSRVGQLYFNSWLFFQEYEVDGVIGVDPVFLQYLLDAVGSIDTTFGVTVDGTNCAAIMLNQSLYWWRADQCDDLYREISSAALKKLLGNLDDIDLSKFITAVVRAGNEGRCSIWMRDEAVESAFKSAGFAHEVKHDPTSPEVGIFISDRSTSKISFYLSNDVVVEEPIEMSDGAKSYDVTMTITSHYDPDAHPEMPSYIKVNSYGLGNMRSDSDMYEEVRLIAPEGGSIENVETERRNTRGDTPDDGEWEDKKYQGLQVKCCDFRIDGGEMVVIRFTVITSPDAVDPLSVRKTPLVPPEIAYWNEDLSTQHPEWTIEKTI